MKTFLSIITTVLVVLVLLCLSSCSTLPGGSKAFLGLDGAAWAGIGRDAGQAAARAAVISYGTRRAVTAAKNPVHVYP